MCVCISSANVLTYFVSRASSLILDKEISLIIDIYIDYRYYKPAFYLQTSISCIVLFLFQIEYA